MYTQVFCTYDPAGNPLTKFTAELKKSISDKAPITYTYDYERLSEVLYPENLFNRVTYTYGTKDDGYGRAGRLSLVEDASGGEAYYYGKMGEVTKTVRTVMASVADIRTYVYGATYDSWNRVRTMTYPDGEVVTYHYDEAGQVESLTSNKQGNESTIVEQIGYDKDGHTVYTKLGNGTETEYAYDDVRQRLQEMNLTASGSDIMRNKYSYDAVDNILGISNDVTPTSGTKLGGASSHTYQYDKLNRLISASGNAKDASYTLNMAYNVMSMPLSKEQTTDGSKTAQSYHNYYKYEDSDHPSAPSEIGHEHYTYDANGNPTRVENDSTAAVREMYWDEDNRLMVLSDNGKTSRYTYNHAGERAVKSHGSMEGVYINGAPQGITFHETDEYTLYPASIISVNKNRFTKHYFIGDKRVASRIGNGSFNNVYGQNGSFLTAGQQDYAERMSQIENQREDYYRELGIAPGIPTMKGSYGDPENTGVGYNTIIKELGDHTVPAEWAQYVKHNEVEGSTPGAPIQWNDPSDPESALPGYGFVADNSGEPEETFYYHSDHLGSTSYITDGNGNITQYDAYLPYGELLVDEHSSSEDLPYKFNGKELDEETGLYYYGARYMQPVASIWYGVDQMTEVYPDVSAYTYCMGNPIKLVDIDGRFPIFINGRVNNDNERGSALYWAKEVRNAVKSQTGYYHSQFRYVDGDQGFWPSTRYKNGLDKGKIDAAQMYSILKSSAKGNVITEQIQIISHSRGGSFANGYMRALKKGIAELAKKENMTFAYGENNIIEYSVNLAPHQSNYISYDTSSPINVNVSHYGDIISGNDATGNVFNIHSNVDKPGGVIDQHSCKSFGIELNNILYILEKGGSKEQIKKALQQFYKNWDNRDNIRDRGFKSTVEDGK